MNSGKGNFKPDLYVVSRIIKSLMDNGPMKKTNLAISAEISYDNLIVYMQWMQPKELLLENNGHVDITEKGIRTYNELVSWIVEYVGKLKFGRT